MDRHDAARLTIDLDAAAHNLAALRAEAPGAEVAPVLKSDAYGLGAGPTARRLWAEGVRSFFVARVSEGEALRAALTPDRPALIYVLDGLPDGCGPRMMAADLTPALCSPAQVAEASAHARGLGITWPVALHFDTGMSRQGLSLDEGRALIQSFDGFRNLDVTLVMSHLGSGSNPENPRNARQLEQFLEARALFPAARASLSSSTGIFLGPDYRFDMVRPGVSLLGGGPQGVPDARLKAVAALTAPILDFRNLKPGDIVGYGDSARIAEPTRAALVAAGYTDGVPRAARGAGRAWFAGALRRMITVNMDVILIEIGDAEARIGDMVELLGPNAALDHLGTAGGSVAHEVLVRLSRRAERIYLGAVQ